MGRHTPHTRDAALRRLRAANRWLIAGSVTLTGVFAAVAANAFPGKTIKSSSATSRAGTRKGGSGEGSGASRLRPPARSPQAGERERSTESPPETEGTTEAEKGVEAEQPVEAEKAVEAEGKVETQPEAPVVSGGS